MQAIPQVKYWLTTSLMLLILTAGCVSDTPDSDTQAQSSDTLPDVSNPDPAVVPTSCEVNPAAFG